MRIFTGRGKFWTIPVLTCTLLGGLMWSPEPAFSAWTVGEPIITYYGGPGREYPQDNASATQLAGGGWNLVWANTVSQLNVAQAHGLRAMWTGSLDNSTVTSICNHPALYSYYVIDEPSATQFTGLAATVSRLHSLDPEHMAYINLFPTYASDAQLGTAGYREYLSQYMSIVQPELLSYDHYQFMVGKDTSDYFKNLALISHTAKEEDIPFLNIIQASSWAASVRVPKGNELRYLYYTSLAYGAAGVSDFVYRYDAFDGGMATASGTTELYDTAKTLNPEFLAIAQQVQSMHHIGAYHLGDLPPGYDTGDGSSPLWLPGNSPFTVSGIAPSTYRTDKPVRGAVLGLYGTDDEVSHATSTLVVNLNYSSSLNTQVTGPGNLSVFDPTAGWIAQNHAWADVSLQPGGSVLVALTASIVNNLPVAVDDDYRLLSSDAVLQIPAAGVLSNDYDIDRDALSAFKVSNPAHGSVVLNSDGSLIYTPQADWHGAEEFTYKANDGEADSNAATVSIVVDPRVKLGLVDNGCPEIGLHSYTLTARGPGITTLSKFTIDGEVNQVFDAEGNQSDWCGDGSASETEENDSHVIFGNLRLPDLGGTTWDWDTYPDGPPDKVTEETVNNGGDSGMGTLNNYDDSAVPIWDAYMKTGTHSEEYATVDLMQLVVADGNGFSIDLTLLTSTDYDVDTGDSTITKHNLSLSLPSLHPGDADGDGNVDADDAAILAQHWLQSGIWADGDFNRDGTINDADAVIMAANWGHTSASSGSVPEPSALILLAGMALAALIRYFSPDSLCR